MHPLAFHPRSRNPVAAALSTGLLLTGSLLGIALPTPTALYADDAVERGLEIAREADRRDSGFGDTSARLEMILRDGRGNESRRQMRMQVLEQTDDGDKSLVIFDSPRDVEGTALLTFSHKDGNDDQWLYLPALKRVKRISSSNKSGPFMGSEFAYEDLSSQEVEEYTYRYLRDETLDAEATFVVERKPVDSRSGYARQVTWIDQEHYRPLRVELYDRKDALLKTLELRDYALYLDQYWRPSTLVMHNHQSGKSTELLWSDYQFRTGLEERDFDRAALARAR